MVQQSLCKIKSRNPIQFLEPGHAHNKLMHTDIVECNIKGVLQLHTHVIGVEHCIFGCFRYTLIAQDQYVAQGAHYHQEVTVKLLYGTNGLGRVLKCIALFGFHRMILGKERSQYILAPDSA